MNKPTSIRLAVVLLMLTAAQLFPKTIYVDDSATGLNDGTSWDNAFTNFNLLTPESMAAGDTIEIAAGFYSERAPNITKSGTPTLPITWKLASDPTKLGHVFSTGSFNLRASNHIFNGALDTNFVVPTSVHDMWQITNNVGWHLTHNSSIVHLFNLNDSWNDNKFYWLHPYWVGKLTSVNKSGQLATNGTDDAEFCWYLGESTTNTELAYIWCEDCVYGEFMNSPRTHENLRIHDSVIYNVGGDMMQVGGGYNFYRNHVKERVWGYVNAHADMMQTQGRRVWVHHNIFQDQGFTNGSEYCSYLLGQSSTTNQGALYFYNNLFYDQNPLRFGAPGLMFSHDAYYVTGHQTNFSGDLKITLLQITNNPVDGQMLTITPTFKSQKKTRWWKDTVASSATNVATAGSMELSLTNLYDHINASKYYSQSNWRFGLAYADATSIRLTGGVWQDYTVTADGWAEITYSTQQYVGASVFKYSPHSTLTNLYIVNNLFRAPYRRAFGHSTYWTETFDWTDSEKINTPYNTNLWRRGFTDQWSVSNSGYHNNILVDCYTNEVGGGTVATMLVNTKDTYPPYSDVDGKITSSATASNNIFVHPNYWIGAPGKDPITYQSEHPTNMYNTMTNMPEFVFYDPTKTSPDFDFRLASTDTNAIAKGVNLTALTNIMPDLDRDLDWNLRPTVGAWDVGPYQSSSGTGTNLILWLNFDLPEWRTNGVIPDASGNGHDAKEYGFGGRTNWPELLVRSSENYGAYFKRWINTNVPDTHQEGYYAAITNTTGLSNLTACTFAAWVYWLGAPSGDWSEEPQQAIINAGYGYGGGTEWGKIGERVILNVWTNGTVIRDSAAVNMLRWPRNNDDSGLSTNGWHHYAWTFDAALETNNIIAYYNGTNFPQLGGLGTDQRGTNTAPAGFVDVSLKRWIGVGVKTHWNPSSFGNWRFDWWLPGGDEYPNHGWARCYMDDVRIYNRALTAAEMLTVYRGGHVTEPPEPPGPPAVTNKIGRVKSTANVETLTAP